MFDYHLEAQLSCKCKVDDSSAAAGVVGASPRHRRQNVHPFIIGVAGGTASGKTTVCDQIMQRLHDQCVVLISQDSYYRPLSAEESKAAAASAYNFDHPDAFDNELILEHLRQLKEGKPVEVPDYDFATHSRSESTRLVEPADVVIMEGILVLHIPEIQDLLHMKIYVDTDDDVRLARRITRDVQWRGRTVESVIEQYTKFVKPSFDQYIAPSRRFADIIIPWQSGHNLVAIDLITQHIRLKLQQPQLRRIYPNLELIPCNYQIRGMHTTIRDVNTPKQDFVFYADRLNRLVVEAGLGHLPFLEKVVRTPTGHQYVGVDFARRLCGVSVIRSGESMETALRACCKGIKIGKVLVHSSKDPEGAHQVVYERLPLDIAERHVLLLDPMLGTGRTACAALQLLREKGVDLNKVLFLSIIAAPEGIHRVCAAFPQVKVITSEIDDEVNQDFCIVPGLGEFGDRYFCN